MLRLLQRHPNIVKRYSHVLVDEFQDTSTIQYWIVAALGGLPYPKSSHASTRASLLMPPQSAPLPEYCKTAIMLVGDASQSIYGWRSADASNFSNFAKRDFPHSIELYLTRNYRSTKCVVSTANAILAGQSSFQPMKSQHSDGTNQSTKTPINKNEAK